jgi:hypothetical protein
MDDILGLFCVPITMNIYSPLACRSRNQPTKEEKKCWKKTRDMQSVTKIVAHKKRHEHWMCVFVCGAWAEKSMNIEFVFR